MIQFILLVTIGYLMGSVCSAIIVSKMFSLPDPRTEGSKNPGATNVLRLAGKQYAAIVIIADMLKGTIPVVIGHLFDASLMTLGFTALAAVVGHIYPVFFDFKGGKGVATAVGAFFGLHFLFGTLVAVTWLVVAHFSRFSSLASIVAICLAPLYGVVLLGHLDIFIPLFIITILILYKHQNNITRLIDKTEPKFKMKNNLLDEVVNSSDLMDDNEVLVDEAVVVVEVKPVVKKATVKKAPAKAKTAAKTTETVKKTTKAAAAPKAKKPAKPKIAAVKKPAKPKKVTE